MLYRELMGKAHPMSFMYDPPPGYKQEEDKVCSVYSIYIVSGESTTCCPKGLAI